MGHGTHSQNAVHTARLWAAGIFISLFCGVLVAPFGLKVFGLAPKPLPIFEGRTLAVRPQLWGKKYIWEWPALLDTYFKDQLAFRSHFIAQYTHIFAQFLGMPLVFVQGRHGELIEQSELMNRLGINPLSVQHLVHMKLSYAAMYAYWHLQGIPYLVVHIPDKATMYSEFLPFYTTWSQGESWYMQQRKAFLDIPTPVLDVKIVFDKYKYEKRLYNSRYDVFHWNGQAVEIAYKEILLKIRDVMAFWGGVIPPKAHYEIVYEKRGNIGYVKELVPVVATFDREKILLKKTPFKNVATDGWWIPRLLFNTMDTKGIIVFASDSYFLETHRHAEKNMYGVNIPLAHHFKKTLHLHYRDLTLPLCDTLLATHRPDFVIEAFAERTGGNAERAINDSRIRILGDAMLQTPGYALTPIFLYQLSQIETALSNNAYTIRLFDTSESYSMTLPPVITDNDGRAMLMARIRFPQNTLLKLHYTEEDVSNAGTSVVQQTYAQGEQLVHMHFLDKPRTRYHIRFTLEGAGEYVFLPIHEVNALRGGEHGL